MDRPSDRSGRVRAGSRAACMAAGVLTFSFCGLGAAKAEFAPGMRLGAVEAVSLTEAVTEPPTPQVHARVDLSNQRMEIFVDDALVNVFPVSSGRMGYGTPPGDYQAQFLAA